jgi:PAS domain S-box-containing protein
MRDSYTNRSRAAQALHAARAAWPRWLGQPQTALAYFLALVLPVAGLMLRIQLGAMAGESPWLSLFVVPLLLSAFIGGLGPGLLATLVTVLMVQFFLPEPANMPPDWRLLVQLVNLVTGVLTSLLIEALHWSRRRAEGDRLLQTITLASIGDAVIATDLSFTITGWNQAAEAMYGWHADQVVGRSVESVLQTEYPHADQENVLTTFRAQSRWQGEVVQRRRDGSRLAVIASVTSIRDASGAVVGAVAVNRDISQRKELEDQTQAAARRLQVLADASRAFAMAGVGIRSVLDQIAYTTADALHCACTIREATEDLRELRLIAHAAEPLELSEFLATMMETVPIAMDAPSEIAKVFLSGKPLLVPNASPHDEHAHVFPGYGLALPQFAPTSMIWVPLPIQGRAVGVLTLLRFNKEQPPFTQDDMVLAQDLADRAGLALSNARLFEQAQHELAERERAQLALEAERTQLAQRVAERTADLSMANAALARASRLKDEFLANMSHELRTPLTAILGRAEILADEIHGPLTTKQAYSVQVIAESGHHLLALINDILDMTKIEAGMLDLELGLVELDLICQSSVRMISQQALEKEISLTTAIDPGADIIRADGRRLRQILVNLLSNAVKFTPRGGHIGLEVRGDPALERVTLTIWDTGIGISADDQHLIFQPFQQIDSGLGRHYEGTGLGLVLVRRLAEAHGGSVALESTPGKGSRFSVVLPWQHQTAELAIAEGPPPAVGPGAPQRLLLVEDSEPTIMFMLEYLHTNDFEVAVVRSGGEALARAHEISPDLILMDIHMPGVDGLEAIRQIRADAQLCDTPIIALTALVMPGDRERCLEAGADLYLTKPVTLGALIDSIRALRDARAH